MSEQTLEELHQNMARQQDRGEFCYWQDAQEAAFKASAPARPQAPDIIGAKHITVCANQHHPAWDDKFKTFAAALECGRSYLVGEDVLMVKFLKDHRSPLTEWQQQCFRWAKANPFYVVSFDLCRCHWRIGARAEYVNFSLPHHDAGGEKDYITYNGRSKILVNVD